MDSDEYRKVISLLLSPNVRKRVNGLMIRSEESFLNDSFLYLLHLASESDVKDLKSPLYDLKRSLQSFADGGQPKWIRARAAVDIGRFVRRDTSPEQMVGMISGKSDASIWFGRARALGDVVGAWEYAEEALYNSGSRLIVDRQTNPLPVIVRTRGKGASDKQSPPVPAQISSAWLGGARVALRHVQRNFRNWAREDFECAIACIVSFVVLPSGGMPATASAKATLCWLDPLWRRLIDAAPDRVSAQDDTDSYRNSLIEQRLAAMVSAGLVDLAGSSDQSRRKGGPITDVPSTPATTSLPAEDVARIVPYSSGAQVAIVVIKRDIPSATDKSDATKLQQFAELRQPVRLVELPHADEIRRIRDTLYLEFPWAGAAVDRVTSELEARRYHGARRLGLSTLLLVGVPGSGKTRFAQRVGDMLSAPSLMLNLAAVADATLLKGTARGWSSSNPSRVVSFIEQTRVANPFFILDELDKLGPGGGNAGDPRAALLDLLEPSNASRYHDVFLLTECDLSHCMYMATANSIKAIPSPLLSRVWPLLFPKPRSEDWHAILVSTLQDLERRWGLPAGSLALSADAQASVQGLSPREMRMAVIHLLRCGATDHGYLRH